MPKTGIVKQFNSFSYLHPLSLTKTQTNYLLIKPEKRKSQRMDAFEGPSVELIELSLPDKP